MDYKFLLESMLTHLDEGILVVDTDANVTLFNEPATDIAGIDKNQAIGKNILEIFPDLTPETSTFYYVLKTKKPLIDYVQNYTNYKGRKVSTVTSTIPLIENGNLIGAIEIYRDLTYLKELSEKISNLQKELFKKSTSRKDYTGNGTQYTLEDIIGKSKPVRELKEKAKKIAGSSSPVLIYGETGTGKELLVQAIHNESGRRDMPFIAQNCAALPETLLEGILFGTTSGSFTGAKDKPGLFELANGGTLFLDEINSMDIGLQAKLLRVLQDGVVRRIGGTKSQIVDVRIIVATNEHPLRAIEARHLRQDLYYRLNVIYLEIPPLRERREDIPVLIDYFIDMYNKKLNKNVRGVSAEGMKAFLTNPWPGNIRELKYTIESIMNFIDNDVIYINDIPSITSTCSMKPYEKSGDNNSGGKLDVSIPKLNEAMESYEEELIKRAIAEARGNHALAARMLGLPRQTLHNKIKKYGIS